MCRAIVLKVTGLDVITKGENMCPREKRAISIMGGGEEPAEDAKGG